MNGGGVLAPGPGHSAADRSLSIKLDANAPEGFLVHSFAGDDPIQCRDYVREKAGLPAFKPNGNGHHHRPTIDIIERAVMAAANGQGREPQGRIVANYDYTDSAGMLLYQVLRYDPKDFRQRRPDGNGGWLWKLGERRVLYRWPELLKFPNATVFLCEGEKDADNVAALGHCATTVASGKWSDECVRALGERDVCILEDNDGGKGRKRALEAAQALHGVANSIRIVSLPDVKDVSDWLEADPTNNTAEKLASLCYDAPLWELEAATEAGTRAETDAESKKLNEATAPKEIHATPFIWRDPATILRRQFLYGQHLVRKFCSATFSAPGIGKSNLLVVEALVMATNRPLLGIQPRQRSRVWYFNGEDPYEEIERRIAAACLHYGIGKDEIEGWLFIDSGRNTDIIIAEETRNGARIIEPVVDALIAEIRRQNIDVLQIDPFVSVHRVGENDNNAIDAVAKKWNIVADATNSAIELAHHTRKTYGAEVTVEDGRGASALLAAARSARTLNVMSEQEAEAVGIITRRRYFRAENGKTNFTTPPERADWYHITSVELGNGTPEDPGDNVGVVTAWKWPDLMAGMTAADFDKVAAEIRTGQWRENAQAKKWVGHAIARALNLDANNKRDRAKIKTALDTWLKAGSLRVVDGEDERRKVRQFVEVAGTGG